MRAADVIVQYGKLADIFEPKFLGPSVYSVSMREKQFLPLKLNKQKDLKIYYLFAHLRLLEVQKYLLSLQYWVTLSQSVTTPLQCWQ